VHEQGSPLGHWYNFDIGSVCKELPTPYLVEGNSGVFYFERGDRAQSFFKRVNRLYAERRDLLGCMHQGRPDQHADEPFLGAAMGQEAIQPLGYTPEEGSIMVTTVWARRCRFDPFTQESFLEKSTGYIIPKVWSRSWQPHSPSVAHFVGLRPRPLYDSIANQLRERADLAPFAGPYRTFGLPDGKTP
jgi:hypothetical protein